MTTAGELLAARRHVLLDFDGPVCAVFGGLTNAEAAERLRRVVDDNGLRLADDVRATVDPFDVLRFVSTRDPRLATVVDATFRELEADAVRSAPITPGIVDALAALVESQHLVTVVSNNDADAIRLFLGAHDLAQYVNAVVGRDGSNIDLLKPHPHSLCAAACQLRTTARQCVMVGDSVADIEAARAFGCAVIAYANKSGKADLLARHHPDAIVTDMAGLCSRR